MRASISSGATEVRTLPFQHHLGLEEQGRRHLCMQASTESETRGCWDHLVLAAADLFWFDIQSGCGGGEGVFILLGKALGGAFPKLVPSM